MSRLAIVISDVGNHELLERTLASVLPNRPADCEILVALNRPYADPYELKDEVRFLDPPPRRASFGTLLNQALATTRAPFVHVLAAGCEIHEDWAEEALWRFGDRQIAAVAPLVFAAEQRESVFAAGVEYRRGGKRCLVGQGLTELASDVKSAMLGPAAFAAFYRKAALDFVGGFGAQLGPRRSTSIWPSCSALPASAWHWHRSRAFMPRPRSSPAKAGSAKACTMSDCSGATCPPPAHGCPGVARRPDHARGAGRLRLAAHFEHARRPPARLRAASGQRPTSPSVGTAQAARDHLEASERASPRRRRAQDSRPCRFAGRTPTFGLTSDRLVHTQAVAQKRHARE